MSTDFFQIPDNIEIDIDAKRVDVFDEEDGHPIVFMTFFRQQDIGPFIQHNFADRSSVVTRFFGGPEVGVAFQVTDGRTIDTNMVVDETDDIFSRSEIEEMMDDDFIAHFSTEEGAFTNSPPTGGSSRDRVSSVTGTPMS